MEKNTGLSTNLKESKNKELKAASWMKYMSNSSKQSLLLQEEEYSIHSNNSNNPNGAGFSWPPRSYACTFCKREFKSAQALGGHMNVHRRDRARLRSQLSPPPVIGQYPSTSSTTALLNINLNEPKPKLNPNPNPNFSSASSSNIFSTSTINPSVQLPGTLSNSASRPSEMKRSWGVLKDMIVSDINLSKMKKNEIKTYNYGVGENFDGWKSGRKADHHQKNNNINVRLEMGICPRKDDLKEDLDLELRLGYA